MCTAACVDQQRRAGPYGTTAEAARDAGWREKEEERDK